MSINLSTVSIAADSIVVFSDVVVELVHHQNRPCQIFALLHLHTVNASKKKSSQALKSLLGSFTTLWRFIKLRSR